MPKTTVITNEPLPLGFGYHIKYNHEHGGPNFRRVDENQVMFLSNHDSSIDKILGTVSNAYHDGNKSYAEINLLDLENDPAIERAKALLNNGMKGVSAGILVHDAHVEGKTLNVDKWELVELSLTPIPRDFGAAVGMSIKNEGGADGLIERFFKNSAEDEGEPEPETPPPEETQNQDEGDDMPPLSTEDIEKIGEAVGKNNESLIQGIGAQVGEALKNALATNATGDEEEDDDPDEKGKADNAGYGRRRAQSRRMKNDDDEELEETDDEDEATKRNAVRKDGHPVACYCNECETMRNEAFKPAVDHPAEIQNMVNIATQQSRYDKDAVLELQMDAVKNKMEVSEFSEKLESIAIHPKPFAPNASEKNSFDIGLALTEAMRGRVKESSYEHSVSDEILNKTEMPIHAPNTLAIPWAVIEQNTKYGGTAGTDSAGSAVLEELLPIIRRDVPDPFRITDRVTRLPSTPGESNVVYIEVPTPTMVAEPGDSGYAKTGDSHTSKVPMTPKLQVDRVLISRLAGVTVPTLLSSILNIGLQKMDEQMNRLMLVGRGSTNNEVTGIYVNTDIDNASDEMTQLSSITAKVITDGMDISYQIANQDKLIVVAPEVRTYFRTLARPTAVGSFFVNGQVDGTPVDVTSYFKYDDSGTEKGLYRGMIFPPRDLFLKQWDDAVFVHTRYEDGNQIMVLESFWDLLPTHPELYYRILDNT